MGARENRARLSRWRCHKRTHGSQHGSSSGIMRFSTRNALCRGRSVRNRPVGTGPTAGSAVAAFSFVLFVFFVVSLSPPTLSVTFVRYGRSVCNRPVGTGPTAGSAVAALSFVFFVVSFSPRTLSVTFFRHGRRVLPSSRQTQHPSRRGELRRHCLTLGRRSV